VLIFALGNYTRFSLLFFSFSEAPPTRRLSFLLLRFLPISTVQLRDFSSVSTKARVSGSLFFRRLALLRTQLPSHNRSRSPLHSLVSVVFFSHGHTSGFLQHLPFPLLRASNRRTFRCSSSSFLLDVLRYRPYGRFFPSRDLMGRSFSRTLSLCLICRPLTDFSPIAETSAFTKSLLEYILPRVHEVHICCECILV